MMKRAGLFVLSIILLSLMSAGRAFADGGLSATGTIAVFSISQETQIRDTNSCAVDLKGLGADEYYSFSFLVTNNANAPQTIHSLYARINGGEELAWGSFELGAKQTALCHIFYSNMGKLGAGTYQVDLYANGEFLQSQYFTLRKDWSGAMALPSAAEIRSFRASDRSPYIVITPDFSGVKRFTEYAVDFKADYLPRGTYLSVCNWAFDLSALEKQYQSVDMQGVSGYCGFQVLEDGTKAAILSLWDVYCKDKSGKTTTIRGKRLFPEKGIRDDTFEGEGVGVHCLVPYDWQEGHPYRALVQLGVSEGNGHTTVIFWACDLQTNAWTRLIEYDTGLTNVQMYWACAFLEDFVVETAGEIRTAELSNFRVFSTDHNRWVPAQSARIEPKMGYPGSYAYGSDGTSFWAITTGLPNRASLQGAKQFSVSNYEKGIPY